ncbi:MAG: glycoside hydrolase family 99-like domain-containing protein [Planctomycetota bacterium]|nr:glycoside hydrolase family 99-like domain-containing protein [Planctomycetota bacterium]
MTAGCPRTIAFYLPQFHPIPENDAWWGPGFTEWRNVTRAQPMYTGHAQPRRPADLGYYDLRLPEVQQEQADLAASHGIHGFCYYHYWFAGKRLLERPLDTVLASGSPTLPFCICWANENWTRRWDGLEDEILIGQQHSPDIDRQFITDLLPTLGDDRYITINGKRLLMVYRPSRLSDCRRATDIWRDEVLKAGLGDLHLVMVQHGDDNPLQMGFDAAVEFPPHGMAVPDIQHTLKGLDTDFRGGVYEYDAIATLSTNRPRPHHPLHRGVMLGWDNTARRGHAATVYHGATPERYRTWLEAMLRDAKQHGGSEDVVFINAWNEWAEGTYLEPDEHNGHQWLEATRDALEAIGGQADSGSQTQSMVAIESDPSPEDISRLLKERRRARSRQRFQTLMVRTGNFMRRPGKLSKINKHGCAAIKKARQRLLPSRGARRTAMEPLWRNVSTGKSTGKHSVLFVGHDAHLAGSQMLLLEMLRMARESSQINPMLLLLGDGVLEPNYQKLVTTCNIVPMMEAGIAPADAIAAAIASAPLQPEVAICSTIACAGAAQVCRGLDVPVVHLINELPTTVESNGWEDLVVDIGTAARRMVFVSRFSQQAFVNQFGLDESRCAIVHPGWLGNGHMQSDHDRLRLRIRKELSLPENALIVLGCGQIHPRKGVDLFVQVGARVLAQEGTDAVHFVWIGDGSADDTRWVAHDIASLPCHDRIHLVSSKPDIHPYFEASDLYVLSSREDPYPIVCVQAMAAGLPVVAFDGVGGAPEALVDGTGLVVPFLDTAAMADSILGLIKDEAGRVAMGVAARSRAQDRCSSKHHFDGVLDVVATTCGVDLRETLLQ